MKIALYHRHHGIHSFIKEMEIPVEFEQVYLGEDQINESLLLEHLPKDFCPSPIKKTLLSVVKEWGSTGQGNLTVFKDWAKYFDAYVVELAPSAEAAS